MAEALVPERWRQTLAGPCPSLCRERWVGSGFPFPPLATAHTRPCSPQWGFPATQWTEESMQAGSPWTGPDQTPLAPACSAAPLAVSRAELQWGPGFRSPIKTPGQEANTRPARAAPAWVPWLACRTWSLNRGHTRLTCCRVHASSPRPGRRGWDSTGGEHTALCCEAPQPLTCSCPSWSAAP